MNKKFWIKERHNPQTGIYYVLCGQLTNKEAKKKENSLYGTNYMLPFPDRAAYEARIEELRAAGERVQS